jgi:hypothetical protein
MFDVIVERVYYTMGRWTNYTHLVYSIRKSKTEILLISQQIYTEIEQKFNQFVLGLYMAIRPHIFVLIPKLRAEFIGRSPRRAYTNSARLYLHPGKRWGWLAQGGRSHF